MDYIIGYYFITFKIDVIITTGDNMAIEDIEEIDIEPLDLSDDPFEMKSEHIFSEPSYINDPTAPFSEFVDNPQGNKFVIAITKSQYVFTAGPGGDHVYMAADLIRTIRPDLETADTRDVFDLDEKFGEHNILVFGFPNFMLLSLPEREMLSFEQYEIIEEMLLNLREDNEKKKNTSREPWELIIEAPDYLGIDGGHFETRIDEVLERLRSHIIDDYEKPDEIIIGRPLSKGKRI